MGTRTAGVVSLLARAPANWDERVSFPFLSTGFAGAAATLGYRAFYVEEGDARAAVHIRALRLPGLASWTSRAKVYVDAGDAGFVEALLATLRARRIAHARVGDAMWGLPAGAQGVPGLTPVVTYLMQHRPAASEAELLGRIASKARTQLRKAQAERVVVTEATCEADVKEYCALAAATHDRMRSRDVAAALPAAFFDVVFRAMVPRGEATFFLARRDGRLIAGAVYLLSRSRMSYYHGVSTRDRGLTNLHGPTAVVWHALRDALRREIPSFDLGATTPTEDPAHPHASVYAFKKRLGGAAVPIVWGEAVLSPVRHAFQDRVLRPVWDRAQGVYLALTAGRPGPTSA